MPMSLKALLVLGSQRRYDAPTDPLHFALKALESCVLYSILSKNVRFAHLTLLEHPVQWFNCRHGVAVHVKFFRVIYTTWFNVVWWTIHSKSNKKVHVGRWRFMSNLSRYLH